MKEKAFLIFLTVLLSSCEIQNNSENICSQEPQRVIVFAPSTVMVCHNPGTKLHQKICSTECYEPGSLNAYCYELPTDICNEGWNREPWISDICKELILEL